MNDPYKTLGVARGATKAQIKAAHRTLAKRYHPDAPTGDPQRFHQVHEAYELLTDPLRRREWDARHAPGPVRADDSPRPPAVRRRRPQPTTAADEGPTAARPEGAARSYRWSASEVPWWEEGARSENRRQPGARRPRGTANPAAEPPPPRSTADFDVYNRSSGAAWSSAARQYFRRFDADLPKHGQFRRQGTQPLTAARARVAAEEEARTHAAASTRQQTPPPPVAAAPPPRPTYAYTAGVARTTEQVNAARAATKRAIRAAAWPSLRERLVYALLAWIPIALLIGYGGAGVTGCDRAAVACQAWFGPAQSVVIAVVLGLLVALPRLSFVGAVGTIALTAASVVLVAFLALNGARAPLSPMVVLVGGTFLIGVYVVGIAVAIFNRSMLPWIARP